MNGAAPSPTGEADDDSFALAQSLIVSRQNVVSRRKAPTHLRPLPAQFVSELPPG